MEAIKPFYIAQNTGLAIFSTGLTGLMLVIPLLPIVTDNTNYQHFYIAPDMPATTRFSPVSPVGHLSGPENNNPETLIDSQVSPNSPVSPQKNRTHAI
jgi:hypothetical protein